MSTYLIDHERKLVFFQSRKDDKYILVTTLSKFKLVNNKKIRIVNCYEPAGE